MNLLLITICLVLITAYTCRKEATLSSQSPESTAPDTTWVTRYKLEIEPILRNRCVPCHFPGGKMYERMPFDEPRTVVNHKDGILRRIKDENEAKKILDFVNQQARP